ncbi:MAG: ester cyclase [Ginsengibacter sp.]
MKQIFFAAFAGLLCICTSCNPGADSTTDTKTTSDEEKNVAAFETVTKAFQTGDISGIDSTVADDFLDHTDKGDVKGKDSLKAMITHMHASFPDMKTTSKNTASNGDYVYGWMSYSGTSDGSMGMPNGPYDMSAIELVKFSDGKAVEHWSFMQPADMMKMMGAPPAPMEKMDTSKMKK